MRLMRWTSATSIVLLLSMLPLPTLHMLKRQPQLTTTHVNLHLVPLRFPGFPLKGDETFQSNTSLSSSHCRTGHFSGGAFLCRLRGGAVYNASWEQSYRSDSPTIWAAARVGDLDNLRRALESLQHPDEVDDDGRTALHWATVAGRDQVVAELLQRGADPLKIDGQGWTPLHCAASCGRAPVLDLVLSAAIATNSSAADLVTTDQRKASPLLLACGKNDSASVQLLLRASTASVTAQDSDGFSPVLRAGILGNMEIVDLLLAHGARINEQDSNGNSSLHYMCNGLSKKRLRGALMLMERGGDPLLENAGGDAPVDYLDYDVATALSREMLALQQRRTGVAQRSEEEQNAIEQKILRAGLEGMNELGEGPECRIFHDCCGAALSNVTHDESMCTRVRATFHE